MAKKQPNPLIEALGAVELFSGLTARQLATVADVCREHHYADGAQILTEGDASGRFFIVLHGTVTVNAHGEDVATLGDGASFGEIGVIDRGERSASIVAVGEVDACSLASFNFRALLREHPDITHRILLAMCARLRRAEGSATHEAAPA